MRGKSKAPAGTGEELITLSSRLKTAAEPPAAQAVPDLWWEKEIPRLQTKIDDINLRLAQMGAYHHVPEDLIRGPVRPTTAREKLEQQRAIAQVELDNARQVAEAHARQTQGAISVAVPATQRTATIVKLTDREKKILAVIERGTSGRQYCRELDNAGIAPLRSGVWKDGPRKYLAAYDLGQPWRHRIEDEKSKIRCKAKKAKLASAR